MEQERKILSEKEKKEKQREIMAIKDCEKRIQAIARNRELFQQQKGR